MREFLRGANAPGIASNSFRSAEFILAFHELDNPRDADTIRSLSFGTQSVCNLRFSQFYPGFDGFEYGQKRRLLARLGPRTCAANRRIATAHGLMVVVVVRQTFSIVLGSLIAYARCVAATDWVLRIRLGGVTDGSTRRLCCGPDAPPNIFSRFLRSAMNCSRRAPRRKLDGAWLSY